MSLRSRLAWTWVLAILLTVAQGCRSAADAADSATTQPASVVTPALGTDGPAPAAAAPPANAPAPPAAAAAPTTAPDLSADLAALKAKWLKALGTGHSAAVRSPFVVIINGDARLAERWMAQTVAPAADRLQKQFMKVRPDKAMAVLLFTDQASYRKACKDVLHVADPPYYGFYRPWERLLVMDINTGGGTLVHELTHAMIAFDFPDIPDWFNEGLGSLYEQCRFEGNKLVGMVNWRLPALQKAIKDGKLGTLEELTRVDFRGEKMGLNYAQARYLCFYMQQHGCLESFYRDFRDGYAQDPSGLKFLRKAFAPRPLADVDTDYRKWVRGLRWPPGR